MKTTYNVSPEMILAAVAMRENGMDYWPYGLADYPVSDNAEFCLYNFDGLGEGGIWLVDTNNSVSMGDAIKLVNVLPLYEVV